MNAIVKGMRLTDFWDQVTVEEMASLYRSAVPTSEGVAALLEIEEKSAVDAKIATWLFRYVDNTAYLEEFLRFVTGSSSLISSNAIQVKFTQTTIEPTPSLQTDLLLHSVLTSDIQFMLPS